MSLVYRRRSPEGPIEQGDILRSVPRLFPELNAAHLVQRSGNTTTLRVKEVERPLVDGDLVAVPIVQVDAVVLTQSCDALRSPFIYLAPIHALDLSNNAVLRGKAVRKSATALDPIGGFYLPDLPPLDWQRRVAHLDKAFSLPTDELQLYARQHRIVAAGLTGRALEYLQHRVSIVFGRMARDDGDWPSLADIQDLRALLESEIAKLEERIRRCGDENERVELQADVAEKRGEVGALEARECAVTNHLAREFPPAGRG
jgi:hypothetical protein